LATTTRALAALSCSLCPPRTSPCRRLFALLASSTACHVASTGSALSCDGLRPDAVTPGRQARTAPTVVVEMADTEGHSQKFADAFSSILADETGPEKKKRRKVKADAVRNQQLRPGSLPQFEMQSDGALLDARVARRDRSCRGSTPARQTDRRWRRRRSCVLPERQRPCGAWSAAKIA
jgi:hypothetical protein